VTQSIPLFAGLALLALAVFFGAVSISRGIRDRSGGDVVTVTGSAKQRIVSDYVIWDVSVGAQADTIPAAAAQEGTWGKAVQSFLSAEGVDASELTVQPISTQTLTASETSNKVTGYEVDQNFEVRSSRVSQITAVAQASSQLVGRGVPISSQPIQYIYTKLPALRPTLLAAAVRDAQHRGAVLLGAAGEKLGKLRGVDVGVFQVTSPNSTSVDDYGEYDTSTLDKDVTAVVNVTFALK
jgi:hypothetical protein